MIVSAMLHKSAKRGLHAHIQLDIRDFEFLVTPSALASNVSMRSLNSCIRSISIGQFLMTSPSLALGYCIFPVVSLPPVSLILQYVTPRSTYPPSLSSYVFLLFQRHMNPSCTELVKTPGSLLHATHGPNHHLPFSSCAGKVYFSCS